MSVEIFPCNGCSVSELENQRFCGEVVVEDELCFVPGISSCDIDKVVILEPDLCKFRVELVCCSVIVVCGMLTKVVTLKSKKTIIQDIVFQANIPVEIDFPEEVNPAEWIVSGVEVCTGCFQLLCATSNNKFHKLREKDVVLIQVSSTEPPKIAKPAW
jgi:hypothetical protein